MKLIIQIPCFNEEATLPQTFADLPRRVNGVTTLETQIIDDGSTDDTVGVARRLGVDHIISFKRNKGLAAAFRAGVDHALKENADILVNTDGDNQYYGGDIAKLVAPILEGKADIVVGCRPIKDHTEFSPLKKLLQRFGSLVLRRVSNTGVRDAASGFRAYSRNALLHINIYSNFSYCMETLIQAGLDNMKIETVDIRVNRKTRESRLFRNILQYVYKSGKTIVAISLLYRAKLFFFTLSVVFFALSVALAARFMIMVYWLGASRATFWPSVVLSGVLLMLSMQALLTGVLASLIGANRQLSEEIAYRLRQIHTEGLALKSIPAPTEDRRNGS